MNAERESCNYNNSIDRNSNYIESNNKIVRNGIHRDSNFELKLMKMHNTESIFKEMLIITWTSSIINISFI